MRSVRILVMLLAVMLTAGHASATEIDGKWGLGIKVGIVGNDLTTQLSFNPAVQIRVYF